MTIEYTPDGTPYLSNSSYLSETPPYTQELAQIIDAGTGGGVCDIKDSKFNDLQPADPVTPFPVGMFVPYMGWEMTAIQYPPGFGVTAPDGWLVCDGRSYDATYFSQLAEICTSFHGDTLFRVPDMRGRAPFGVAQWGDDWGDMNDEYLRPARVIWPGAREGDWRIQQHRLEMEVAGQAGEGIYGLQNVTSGNTINTGAVDTRWGAVATGVGENMPPFTGTYFIVYTGKPTLDENGDILPECGQGDPIMPKTTRQMIEDRLAVKGITEEEVKMLKEQLEEIKKTEAK